jgi:hypothetical protein
MGRAGAAGSPGRSSTPRRPILFEKKSKLVQEFLDFTAARSLEAQNRGNQAICSREIVSAVPNSLHLNYLNAIQ